MKKFVFRSSVFLLAVLLLSLPRTAFAAKMIGLHDAYTPAQIAESIPAAVIVATSHTELISAISSANVPTVIELGSDINTTSTITIPADTDITLTGNYSLIAHGNFPVVTVNGAFTLDGSTLTRIGTIGNSSQGVNVRDTGHFTMLDGVIHGNRGTGGGGVNVPIINFGWDENWNPIERSGNFTMYGGIIRDNTSNGGGGGGVFSGGSFVMHGGVIKDNTETASFGLGGGVNVNDGRFVMYDGVISGNSTVGNNGGGLHVHMSAAFEMNGGYITGNHSANGGGGVNANGSFTLNAGQITGNTAANDGGGVFHRGSFNMNDGIISGNTAPRNGGGVFVDGALVMHNGEISGNTANGSAAANGGGGVFVSNWGNFTMHGGHMGDNTAAADGGGVFFPVARRTLLTISSNAVFRGNTAGNGVLDYGRGAGLRDFPNIQWRDANSIPDSHLLNNYDINNATVGVPGPLTVVFDLNGGLVNGSPASISLSITQGEFIGADNVPVPTRENHNFSGWQIVGTGEILSAEVVATLAVTRPMAFAAVWTPITAAHHGWRQAYLIGTPSGLVRPSGNITRAEVATILFRLISDTDREQHWAQSNPFPDVVLNDWFNNAVSTTTNMDLFKGLRNGTFAPNRPITRAELSAVIARFMHPTGVVPTEDAFNDIGGHWASHYINLAAANGWVQGPHGLGHAFYPDRTITRAEVAAMINRIFGRLPETADDLLPDMRTWQDNADTGRWYYLYIQSASNSYTYRIKTDGIHESWVTIIPPRNWANLERPDSTPNRW